MEIGLIFIFRYSFKQQVKLTFKLTNDRIKYNLFIKGNYNNNLILMLLIMNFYLSIIASKDE